MREFHNNQSRKKAVIAACYGSYFFHERIEYIYHSLCNCGCDTMVLMSDYDHLTKKRISDGAYPEYVHFVPTKPYRKNVSVSRIFSHLYFSYRLYHMLCEERPDVVYYLAPPNSVAYSVSLYKKQNPSSCIITDVMDLWPEGFPIPHFNSKFNIFAWIMKELRKRGLVVSDGAVLECSLYEKKLSQILPQNRRVIHLPARELERDPFDNANSDSLNIAYIGQVSKLIDIDKVIDILSILMKRYSVAIYVIGAGCNYENFICRLRNTVTEVHDYGAVYDVREISHIFSKCHYGLNIMKDSVQVGLTMKSMTYIGLNIPLINNIKHDTWELIEKYQAGYNIESISQWCEIVMSPDNDLQKNSVRMSGSVLKMKGENLDTNAIQKAFNRYIFEIVDKDC